MNYVHEQTRIMLRDVLTVLCDDYIGAGASRETYACKFDKTMVVKVEVGVDMFQNVKEWLVWQRVRNEEMSRWFAPCVEISDHGNWLLQKRTGPISQEQIARKLPRIPKIFTDLKAANWGWLDGRIVCHDYGTCLVPDHGLRSGMRKAQWW